jgi:predicted dinucleotide-binding enzyme
MGMPPVLFTGPGDSLGERIQHSFPRARVVKGLNTVNAEVMGHPERLGGESDLFVCGNDADAKGRVTALLREFGWKTIHDLGDIRASRGMEAYLLFWITVAGALKTPAFNIRIVR